MNFTPISRLLFARLSSRARSWQHREEEVQSKVLKTLLAEAADTEFGRNHGFRDLLASADPVRSYSEAFAPEEYEAFRPMVMRMVEGERDILWPGRCDNYAQSSGTSGGRSKYVPVTSTGLRVNHYGGAAYTMALYLDSNQESRIFAGKGLILGGSFATELHPHRKGVRIGDLSATLIDKISPAANFFRVPDKGTALLADWEKKLPMLASKAAEANITSLSGVPSWMLRVLLKVLEIKGVDNLLPVWPGLEVFFHGGISFDPYREEYEKLTQGLPMHFFETYNASEGYFATADSLSSHAMLLLLEAGVYYEFLPIAGGETRTAGSVKPGKVYELIISSCNGLWRYRTGDTVKIESVSPLRITIAGRTHSFINAFGEELMEDNAEQAIAAACKATGASIVNYHAAPVYAEGRKRGRHQWIVEWGTPPRNEKRFAQELDDALRTVNSDYDAKRKGTIFLDPLEIISVAPGHFDRWLASTGTHKLGGQRKVPRLANDRRIADTLLSLR